MGPSEVARGHRPVPVVTLRRRGAPPSTRPSASGSRRGASRARAPGVRARARRACVPCVRARAWRSLARARIGWCFRCARCNARTQRTVSRTRQRTHVLEGGADVPERANVVCERAYRTCPRTLSANVANVTLLARARVGGRFGARSVRFGSVRATGVRHVTRDTSRNGQASRNRRGSLPRSRARVNAHARVLLGPHPADSSSTRRRKRCS